MPETELSDSELIKAFGEGDHAAFETLYHRYRRQLYGFLSNLIPGNPAEVDEVFEETCRSTGTTGNSARGCSG